MTLYKGDTVCSQVGLTPSSDKRFVLSEKESTCSSCFQKGDTPAYRQIYSMMQQAPLVKTGMEAMDLVMQGDYAFMTDREQLELLQKRDCSNLVQGEEHFNNNGLGFFVQRGSPLLEPLSNQ